MNLEYTKLSKTAARIADSGFANDHIRVSISDRFVVAAKRTKKKISSLLTFMERGYGFRIECPVDRIIKTVPRPTLLSQSWVPYDFCRS